MESSDDTVSLRRIVEFIEQREAAEPSVSERSRLGQRIAVSLHHFHLPKLEEASVLVYRPQKGTVEYLGDNRLERIVTMLMSEEKRCTEAVRPTTTPEADRPTNGPESTGVDRAALSLLVPDDYSASATEILDHELPPAIENVVDEYERSIGDRDTFLWKWLHRVFPFIRLSCVSAEHESRVRTLKFVSTIYGVLLDDLIDRRQDRTTFEEAVKIPFSDRRADSDRPGVNGQYLAFARQIWDAFAQKLAEAPRNEEFADIFQFDVEQNVNAIDYASVSNATLEMNNLVECESYGAHNMMLFTYMNIDLMHSPSFDERELSTLRRIVVTAQEMARIGNWITTWEREVHEGDFSSGVVVYALENGVVDPEELYRLRETPSPDRADAIIDRIRDEDVEAYFLDRWAEKRDVLRAHEGRIRSVDVSEYVTGIERVLGYHLASEGWK